MNCNEKAIMVIQLRTQEKSHEICSSTTDNSSVLSWNFNFSQLKTQGKSHGIRGSIIENSSIVS